MNLRNKRPISYAGLFGVMLAVSLGLAGCGEQSAQEQVDAGKARMQKKEYKAAVIDFKNALQKDGQLAEARQALAQPRAGVGHLGRPAGELLAEAHSTPVAWDGIIPALTTKKIESSLELAWTAKEAMVTHMNGHYAVNDHGVKTAPFYVLRFTSMPSILAEIAYISNPDEERLLRKPAFIEDVAQALFKGITGFLAANKPDPR